ncbi:MULTISPECIES: GNAT family N-acetyltransferase [Vibrio]|uniref:N-acetyltransferase n=1 Tax=Vibrio casei TaxID=673372 RepID=A0A368LIY8_9VIBR|nr:MULTISPECIES: GNAT family protein [Vibrio]RCS70641.1 N-acetyltransferase [Vibrio casei]SJN27123.1 Ribosomal-protein-L7p-serine acetyltransferase [Vibrio casei]HBV77756.1 N-acetyltransferase [Vibrio sp.]
MFVLEVDSELKLALIEPSFAKQYLDIVSSQQTYLSRWLAWPPYAKTEDFFLRFIRKSLLDYAEGKSMTCGILYQDNLVGNISFNTINHSLKMAEIGYWLSEVHQGKGIITRSVTKFIDIAFTDFGLEKVQIAAGVENQPSRSVCERLGMKLEGTISHRENLNGRIIDHAVYGLLKAESEY